MVVNKPPVIWSTDAIADLSDIWNYYANVAGRHTADKIIREISIACRLLEDHPFAGRARSEVRPELRSLVARPHVIFYRVRNDIADFARAGRKA